MSLVTKQWGSLTPTKSDTTVTLPIAYLSKHCAVVASITDTAGTGGLYCANGKTLNLSNFVLAVEDTGKFCCWISIGF